jgi:phosphomevalonate kinase
MRIEARSPGKMILIGEYAVLEGAISLVAAVDRMATVSMHCGLKGKFSLSAPNLDIEKIEFSPGTEGQPQFSDPDSALIQGKMRFFEAVFSRMWNKFRKEVPNGIAISIDTSEFFLHGEIKLGLGSSAALTCALTAGLYAWFNKDISQRKLFKESLDLHYTAQGYLGSGIDIAAGVFGGILAYRRMKPSPEVTGLKRHDEIFIVPVWSGQSASTIEMVGRVSDFKNQDPDRYNSVVSRMTDSSEKAVCSWSERRIDAFLSQIDHYNDLMAELGVLSRTPIVSTEHERIGRIIRKYRGVYKPSGAGGGDLGLAFWAARDAAPDLLTKLISEGIKPIELRFGAKGTSVHRQFNN